MARDEKTGNAGANRPAAEQRPQAGRGRSIAKQKSRATRPSFGRPAFVIRATFECRFPSLSSDDRENTVYRGATPQSERYFVAAAAG